MHSRMKKLQKRLIKGIEIILLKLPSRVLDFICSGGIRLHIITEPFAMTVNSSVKLKKYAVYLISNFDNECKRIVENRQCMEIEAGQYQYNSLTGYFINNVVGLMLYAMYNGCIPVVKINSDVQDAVRWDWYFMQLYDTILKTDISKCSTKKCDIVVTDYHNFFQNAFCLSGRDFQIWSFLYKKFIVLNADTNKYISDELKLCKKEKTLGILMRGTDYTTLRPKRHPVQPDVSEVLSIAERLFQSDKGYKKIYVATEEKRLFDEVCSRFGKEIVLSNQRMYYDEQYYSKSGQLIGNVRFDRENDSYLRGLEYLSSLFILSACEGIVAGNCGGTLFAVTISSSYEDVKIIDKGFY